ncbi:MAG: 37S ribosomal protein S24, mitochondrial [Peltula sp. TS41687]|nr:MAG: 37S ribosomal protein S24, mitochondrial [Peltula sp. TS41687]
MAAWLRRVGSTARCSASCQFSFRTRPLTSTTTCFRDFSSSSRRRKEVDEGEERDASQIETRVSAKHFASTLPPTQRAVYDALTPADKHEFQVEFEEMVDDMNAPDVQAALNAEISNAANEAEFEMPEDPKSLERVVPGLLNMGEEDPEDTGNDDDFMGDDISSSAHAELDEHREIREYARIAAWEMPLLSRAELAKPFVPPGKEKPLRFRYTTYMGEQHPAEKKVVVEFCTQDMPDLTELQRDKFIKLVGVRYNPETDIVKMSCEMFETQAQNKRYLGDLVNTLLREARDSTDTFADIQFDFRHHTFKKKLKFPDEWRMTAERRDYLDRSRQEKQLLDDNRIKQYRLIDGAEEVIKRQKSLAALESKSRTPVVVESAKGGKGGKRSTRVRELTRF